MRMAPDLVTVDQAAQHLHLHPKTVLRYIRNGRLSAARVGKSYRITRAKLDEFAGVVGGQVENAAPVRATCIVEIPDLSVDAAERLATFLQAAALAHPADTRPLHLQTAFDPLARSMRVVMIASPAGVAELLEMLKVHLGRAL